MNANCNEIESPRKLNVSSGHGDLPKIDVCNDAGHAEIYLHGGLVHRFKPAGQDDVLWGSQHAVYDGTKAIRAGIPICWPWFGTHPSNQELPSHGFVRNQAWQVESSSHDSATETTSVILSLQSDESMHPWFPHDFRLELTVHVSSSLKTDLIIFNQSETEITFSTALHNYLYVSDIDQTHVEGLSEVPFIDNLDAGRTTSEYGVIRIHNETERVYFDAPQDVLVVTPERKIRVSKQGSNSTVIWNPWIEKSKRTADMGDSEYRHMLCVETASNLRDFETIQPGSNHLISQTISVEDL